MSSNILEEELLSKIIEGDKNGIKLLLEKGANIHYKKDQALINATENGDLDMIKLLIENGADVNAQYGAPLTASVDGGFFDNIKYLISKGANLELNEFNDLYLAAERGYLDILKYFLEEERSVERYDRYIELLQDIFMEAVRGGSDEMIKYIVETQHVDIHAQDDEAMYLAIKNLDEDTVNYLINQANSQDIPYTIENLIRLRTLVEGGLHSNEVIFLQRLFPWGIQSPLENDNIEGNEEYTEDFDDDGEWISPWENMLPGERLSDEASIPDSDDFSDEETPTVDNRLSESDYEEDEHKDKGYEYISDDESIDDPVIVKEGEDVKDKIKKVCVNDSSPITLEEYEDLNDLYTIYTRNREGDFFEKGDCGSKSELKDYLNSDKDQEIPSFFMAIGTTPRLHRDLITGFTSKPTAKIVVRLPNNLYVTLNSVKRILSSNGHVKWFALPLYNGKKRRIVNLRGFYGIGNNHGQIPGFIVYKLFTGSEIKKKITVKEGTDDYPSFYLHDMMEPLFVILEKYNTPIQKFINGVIKDATK